MSESLISRKKILFVDDEEQLRSIFKLFFSSLEYEYLDASNGEIGVAMAKEHIPDLIIMDYKMPVMDGVKAIEAIRSQTSTSHIPIIMYTGYINDLDFREVKQFSRVEILKKPIEVHVWMKIIEQYLFPLS